MNLRYLLPLHFLLACAPELDQGPGPDLAFQTEGAPDNLAQLHSALIGVEPVGAPATLTSGQVNERGDQLGRAMVIADFTGDGRGDLAIGVPFEDIGSVESSGSVLIYRGTGAGLVFHQALTQAGLGVDEPFDHFGSALAAGDFDGNGVIDLAVGAPDEAPGGDPAAGAVFIFRGGANLTAGWVIDQASLGSGTNENSDRFGEALAALDFSGDGRAELAVGAPGDAVGGIRSGRVYLVSFGAAGPVGAGTVVQGALSPDEPAERFGSALAGGNFFGGAKSELAVGAYGETVSGRRGGAVFIYQPVGAVLNPVVRLAQASMNEHKDLFGRSLAVGDFNGDGWRDLAVGAPGENRQQGAIFIYNGGAAALSPGQVIDPKVDGVSPGDKFAWALAAGDIDADGDADLVVGAPRSILAGNVRSGKVIWYRSTAGVLAAVSPLTQTHFAVGNTDDEFGRAVAVGDLGADGRAEIAVGAPTETVGQSRVGSAYVFRGVGADPAAWRRVVQATP